MDDEGKFGLNVLIVIHVEWQVTRIQRITYILGNQLLNLLAYLLGCCCNFCLFVFFAFCQDLTAINVTKTGHRKKILSESAKLESRVVFPREKPVSCNNSLYMNSWILSGM